MKRHFYLYIIILAFLFSTLTPERVQKDLKPYMESDSYLLIPQNNTVIMVLELPPEESSLSVKNLNILKDVENRLYDTTWVKSVKSVLNSTIITSSMDDIKVSPFLPDNLFEMEKDEQEKILAELSEKASQFKELKPYISTNPPVMSIFADISLKTSALTITEALNLIKENTESIYNIQVSFTGLAPVSAEAENLLTEDLLRLVPVLLIFVSFIFVLFKNLKVYLISWSIIGLSSITALQVIRTIGLEVTPLVIVIPIFAIGLLSDYTIHFFYHRLHDYEVLSGPSVRNKLLLPLSLTGISTITGFISLGILKGEGHLFLGFVIALSILIILGFCFFWFPYITLNSHHKMNRTLLKIMEKMQERIFKVSYKARHFLFALFSIVLLLSFYQLKNLKIEPYPIDQFPESSIIRQAEDLLFSHFSGTIPFFIEIDTGESGGVLSKEGLTLMENFNTIIEETPEVGFYYSLLTVIKNIHYYFNDSLDEYYSVPDEEDPEIFSAIIEQYLLYYSGTVDPLEYESMVNASYRYTSVKGVLKYRDTLSLDSFLDSVSRIEEMMPEGWSLTVQGGIRPLINEAQALRRNWMLSFITGIVLIFLSILLFYRKFKLALFSLLPALYSMSIALGLISFLNLSIDSFSIIFVAIITGLVVDYSIHTLVALIHSKQQEDFNYIIIHGGIPITLSFLTSLVSFFLLFFSSFQGARILSVLLVISLIISVYLSLYLLPILTYTTNKKRKKSEESS